MGRTGKRLLWGGAAGAVAYAAWAWWRRRVPADTGSPAWGPAPFPFPPAPTPTGSSEATPPTTGAGDGKDTPAWRPPAPDGSCPDGFPVKAKLASGIYHSPGGASYDRTRPDRCYPDEAAARRDGLRAARS